MFIGNTHLSIIEGKEWFEIVNYNITENMNKYNTISFLGKLKKLGDEKKI